jgi:hypothetical protein
MSKNNSQTAQVKQRALTSLPFKQHSSKIKGKCVCNDSPGLTARSSRETDDHYVNFVTQLKRLNQLGVALVPLGGDNGKQALVKFKDQEGFPAGSLTDLVKDGKATGIGFRLHSCVVVDIDSDDPAWISKCEDRFGKSEVRVRTPSGGIHLYYAGSLKPQDDLNTDEIIGIANWCWEAQNNGTNYAAGQKTLTIPGWSIERLAGDPFAQHLLIFLLDAHKGAKGRRFILDYECMKNSPRLNLSRDRFRQAKNLLVL